MKLFHKEKEKEVVYVQMQDLVYLMNETDIAIPASIVMQVFGGGTVIVTNENRFDFVRFDDAEEVKYFRDLDFILDYGEYKDLSDDQLEERYQKFAVRINEIVEKWNKMSVAKRKKSVALYAEYQNLNYIIKFLHEIYNIKHGTSIISFPSFIK